MDFDLSFIPVLTKLELVLFFELVITWIALCRCEVRKNAIAWSFFWWLLIPIMAYLSIRNLIRALFNVC